MRYGQSKPTISIVKRELVQDSIERKKLVEKLIGLVREEERAKTIAEIRALYPHIEADLQDAKR